MNARKNVVTEQMFLNQMRFFTGSYVAIRFKNVDDYRWRKAKIAEVWGLNMVGYSKPCSLTVVVESDANKRTLINAQVLKDKQAEYQLELSNVVMCICQKMALDGELDENYVSELVNNTGLDVEDIRKELDPFM